MTPGRSLSSNTTGRSIAPVARTIRAARMRCTRWRERPAGACAEVVGAPLQGEHEPVVPAADVQWPNAVVRCRWVTWGCAASSATVSATNSVAGRPSIRSVPVSVPPGGRAVVDEHDVLSGAGGPAGGGEAGRSGADDEHVAVGVAAVVPGEVGDLGEPALAVDPAGDEPVGDLDGGRQEHRLGEGLLDLDEAGGVLGPRGGDPARPPVLHAGAERPDAVGEQDRGEGVAGVAGVGAAVDGDGQGAAAVEGRP